jgi:dsRNA-specific ribonuclease
MWLVLSLGCCTLIRYLHDTVFGFCLQIQDFVKEFQDELLKPGFNFFDLSDCKAPKVLADIVESIAGAIFLDNGHDTAVVWKVSFSKET